MQTRKAFVGLLQNSIPSYTDTRQNDFKNDPNDFQKSKQNLFVPFLRNVAETSEFPVTFSQKEKFMDSEKKSP